jgi:hypothetical protein
MAKDCHVWPLDGPRALDGPQAVKADPSTAPARSTASLCSASRAWSQFWSHSPAFGDVQAVPARAVSSDMYGFDLARTHASRLGKRVGGNPSRVRIPRPLHSLIGTSQ